MSLATQALAVKKQRQDLNSYCTAHILLTTNLPSHSTAHPACTGMQLAEIEFRAVLFFFCRAVWLGSSFLGASLPELSTCFSPSHHCPDTRKLFLATPNLECLELSPSQSALL